MPAYYNEIDLYAAQWLRNLIAAGHVAPGDVDDRDIREVKADDLKGYEQCHFFAGVGGWSVALRQSGWPDDRPVWTGSCPCQPFSAAGAGKAANDERHLWPAWFSLIAECGPSIIFGEQVEAAIGWGWLDVVFNDLEAKGYSCGATVLPACGIGAHHIRQRLWFVADAQCGATERHGHTMAGTPEGMQGETRVGELGNASGSGRGYNEAGNTDSGCKTAEELRRDRIEQSQDASGRLSDGELAHAASGGQREFGDAPQSRSSGHPDGGFVAGILADTECNGGRTDKPKREAQGREANGRLGAWDRLEWLKCTDGKWRPVEPGSFPLAHGVQRRTSKLRAYGNAIVPQVAAEFIQAFSEIDSQ